MTVLSWSRGEDSATVDLDDGARVTALTLAGRELLLPRRDRQAMWWGGFVMAPWTSLLRPGVVPGYQPDGDEAWHGTARALTWRRTAAGAVVDLPAPFEGLTAALGVRLGEGELLLRLAVTTSGPELPAAIGWHPWFPRALGGVEGRLRVRRDTLAQERDDDGRPTGNWGHPEPGPWNDGARLAGPAAVQYPGVGAIEVSSSSPYAILFEHEQGFCIEPTTAPAESLGRAVTVADPVELEIRVAWIPEVEPLP